MEVKAWSNGDRSKTGAGYGIRIRRVDRDNYFDRNWKTVFIHLGGKNQPIEVNTSRSFQLGNCQELRSSKIGIWLIENNLAPWKYRNPPKLQLIPLYGNHFRLKK